MTSSLEQMYAVVARIKESHEASSSEALPKRRTGHTVCGENRTCMCSLEALE